jgi:hypothetical protein
LNIGLRTIRRRQRSLTTGVLALFCAAWLQAAVVPCVMAHASDSPPVPTATPAAHPHDGHAGHEGHDGHSAPAGHDHDGTAAGSGAAAPAHPCPYCPPGDSGAGDCDEHGGCVYPHDPQVDGRAGGTIFAALPLSFVAPSPQARLLAADAFPATPDVVARVSLSVSYCRFIE